MKFGFTLPLIGTAASADAVTKVAKRAEELGYDSLWTTDRVLYPQNPQSPYGGIEGMPIPEEYKISLDPLHTLTFAAAQTSRIRLGVSLLVIGYYNPVLLARSLTTIDIFSNGRLNVSFGQGWSKDEFDAVGTSMSNRGERADEFLEVLNAIWDNEVVEFKGKYFQIPKSTILPKPVQKPHPPIYMAAYSPGAIQRTATYADGYNPVGMPSAEIWEGIKQAGKAAGRNPDEYKLLLRANVTLTDSPLPDNQRWPFSGSSDQIKRDIADAKAAGTDELFFDPTFSAAGRTIESYLKSLEMLRELAR